MVKKNNKTSANRKLEKVHLTIFYRKLLNRYRKRLTRRKGEKKELKEVKNTPIKFIIFDKRSGWLCKGYATLREKMGKVNC
jgi:hypothetical protein